MDLAFEEVKLDDRDESVGRGDGEGVSEREISVGPTSSSSSAVPRSTASKPRDAGPGTSTSTGKGSQPSDSGADMERTSSQTAAEGSSEAPIVGGSIVGDVLYSIATGEEEGKSRARILAFAAKRYQTAVDKNPKDYDALYNWALVLQESADNCGPEVGLQGKDSLLEEACHKYQSATTLCDTLHEAFYNWAIAISDRAKMRGRTAEAEELWKQACDKYERAVQLNWDSPQALNNWGLALQELGNIVPAKEKRGVIRKAINKFSAAIRLRYDFHRAIYNLGTVLYGLAEDTSKAEKKASTSSTKGVPLPAIPGLRHSQEIYAQSAVYIASAHALKGDYPVYRNALRLVRTMLPLPYLKAGFLTVPPKGNAFAPHSEWKRKWFVLDHEKLKESKKPEPKLSSLAARTQRMSASGGNTQNMTAGGSHVSPAASIAFASTVTPSSVPLPSPGALGPEEVVDPPVCFPISSVLSVETCADLSLPRGGGITLGLPSGLTYLVADDWDTMDSWVDAIRLVYTIYVRGKSDELSAVLAG